MQKNYKILLGLVFFVSCVPLSSDISEKNAALAQPSERVLFESCVAKTTEFCLSPVCSDDVKRLIQPCIDNEIIWRVPLNQSFSEDGVVFDVFNVIHYLCFNNKSEHLRFLCEQLKIQNKLNFLNNRTLQDALTPAFLAIFYKCWEALTLLFEYGVELDPDAKNLLTNCDERINKNVKLAMSRAKKLKLEQHKSDKKNQYKMINLRSLISYPSPNGTDEAFLLAQNEKHARKKINKKRKQELSNINNLN